MRYWQRLLRRGLVTMILAAVASAPATAQEVTKYGLVLGGGGAKGAAHSGVLEKLEKKGVDQRRLDGIVGTSIGSIVGGMYACGYTARDIQQMFLAQEWADLLGDRNDTLRSKLWARDEDGTTYILGFPVGRRKSRKADGNFGIMRGDRIVRLFEQMIVESPWARTLPDPRRALDSISFDSLAVPFRCVAVDIDKSREYVFSSGRLALAMRASMAIPGIFKPVSIRSGGKTLHLVDGGMLNNLPVDVVLGMGARRVIAVDLLVNEVEEKEEGNILSDLLSSVCGTDGSEEAQPSDTLKSKTLLSRLLRWYADRPDDEKYIENRRHADVYIHPDLSGFTAASFQQDAIRAMIEEGRKAKVKLP